MCVCVHARIWVFVHHKLWKAGDETIQRSRSNTSSLLLHEATKHLKGAGCCFRMPLRHRWVTPQGFSQAKTDRNRTSAGEWSTGDPSDTVKIQRQQAALILSCKADFFFFYFGGINIKMSCWGRIRIIIQAFVVESNEINMYMRDHQQTLKGLNSSLACSLLSLWSH